MTRMFVGGLATETNTFSPIPTRLADFEAMGIRDRQNPEANPAAVGRMLSAIRLVARPRGVLLTEGLFAAAPPLGRVEAHAFAHLRDRLIAELTASEPDAALFILHGAMVAENCEDCEGDILEQARSKLGPDTPIAVVCDPHCHLTRKMVDNADIIVCFRRYPHIDTAETAAQAALLLLDLADGSISPTTAVIDCRMTGLWPTTEDPGKTIVEFIEAVEQRPGVLAACFGHGFPWGDVPEAGAKAWVITDGDGGLARSAAQEIADMVWSLRDGAVPDLLDIDAALDQVEKEQAGLTVIADMADNPGGGAPGDSTFLLSRVLERGMRGVAVGCVWDPRAVSRCREAGVGARLSLLMGGKSGPASGEPVEARVEVMALEAEFAQQAFGAQIPFGSSARVRTDGGVDIVLVSERQQVLGPDAFTGLGLELAGRRAVIVKSAQHFRAGFDPIAARTLRVGERGALSHDFASLDYKRRDLCYWPRVVDPFRTCA